MLMPSLCQEGRERDVRDTAGWSDSPMFSLLFTVRPFMAAAPAGLFCELMAFPALTTHVLKASPSKWVLRSTSLYNAGEASGDWPVAKL